MEKDKNFVTLAVIDNYNFCGIQTDKHGDSMSNPAQRPESVKRMLLRLQAQTLTVATPPGVKIHPFSKIAVTFELII